MIVINARNVNHALYESVTLLNQVGVERESRNGKVLVFPEPVTTLYTNPRERVLFHPGRDANPFFHLVESLWMLAGRRDLAPLTKYVRNMAQFSDDDGMTQPGAYGYRWRNHFEMDQLTWAVRRLMDNPNDRRVVVQMWDPFTDILAADYDGADVPCNLIALPTVGLDGRLDLTVYNRSNDVVWGAYGANAVHFSVLQEWIAFQLGIPMGRYWQVSNNLHAYEKTFKGGLGIWPWATVYPGPELADPYGVGEVISMSMFERYPSARTVDGELNWLTEDINMFLDNPARIGIQSEFLRKIACPMVLAHKAFKKQGGLKGIASAREILEQMPIDNDWRMAAKLWFDNRETKLKLQQDDGVHYESD